MKTIVVVNGEQDWQEYFPGYEVYFRRLQTSRWFYDQNHLWVFDGSGASVRVDSVLWRVGAIRPHPNHRSVLEMIRLARVPSVNSASVLLRGFERLSMLNEMREAGLPVIPYSVAVGERLLEKIQPPFPAVLKIGNYHAGFGKAKIDDRQQWQDIRDLIFISEEYATIEPYIDYVQDIRCLAVGDQLWAMSRRSQTWRANAETVEYQMIDVPETVAEYTRKAMSHLGADVLGLDFLQTRHGDYVLLESNDIPGLSGFPDEVKHAIANQMRTKLTP